MNKQSYSNPRLLLTGGIVIAIALVCYAIFFAIVLGIYFIK
jgi:hypothetical protein